MGGFKENAAQEAIVLKRQSVRNLQLRHSMMLKDH